jgi:hypothetical protein
MELMNRRVDSIRDRGEPNCGRENDGNGKLLPPPATDLFLKQCPEIPHLLSTRHNNNKDEKANTYNKNEKKKERERER